MSNLYAAFFFGTLGMGYAVYGRKQRKIVALVAGLGLMGAPYLVSNIWGLAGTCLVLLALPFVLKIG